MKRVLAVLLLILALSFPVLAGHTVPGNFACECGMSGYVEDYVGECSSNQRATSPQDNLKDTTALGILILALLFWLRLKA
ncbi:MAG: hypothetical protein WBV94_11640 [Blastocatellia bacterium]